MEIGREEVRKLLGSLERIARANEKLIELAEEERIEDEAIAKSRIPGYCPHCTRTNPRVRSEGAAGLLDEVVLVLTCENCGNRFFVVPTDWMIAQNADQVREMMKEAGIGTP